MAPAFHPTSANAYLIASIAAAMRPHPGVGQREAHRSLSTAINAVGISFHAEPRADGPASGQWYLRAPEGEVVSSIDVGRAWDVTTGSPGIVVAVLDTGVRFEHPDLRTVGTGGNLLPGYDMVSDTAIANDGDASDADAAEPGD